MGPSRPISDTHPGPARAGLLAVCLLVSCLGGAGAGAAGAQERSRAATDGGFGEVVDVELVNVEVRVTDRKGQDIEGLGATQFELFEDGKPVAITHFDEIRSAPLTLGPTPDAEPPEDVHPNGSASSDGSGLEAGGPNGNLGGGGGWLVLYFDQTHLGRASQQTMVEDLRQWIRNGTVPAERVLVVRQHQQLTTETLFGSSREEVLTALDRIGETVPLGDQTASDKRLAVDRIQAEWERAQSLGQGDPCTRFPRQALPNVEAYTLDALPRVRTTLSHLGRLSSFLAAVPGPKSLIFISDALEMQPGADILRFIEDVCPSERRVTANFAYRDGLGTEFRRLTSHANANRITIYALQSQGLRSASLRGADQRSMDFRGTGGFELTTRNNERDGLSHLALDTGGKAVFNQNDFDQELEDISTDMRSYYSLAYSPPHGGDELEHRIEVRVDTQGARVRHRQGYRHKNARVRLAERLQGALHLGWVENPLEVRLGMGDAETRADGMVHFPLHVRVPGDGLTFLPSAGGELAQVQVQVLTRPLAGKEPYNHEATFDLARPERSDLPLDLVVPVELAPGIHILAVGVRDRASQETAVVSTNLEIPGTTKK